ncbi:MAG: succinate dehydrogenase, partial [Acidimicrobiales bacterium]
MATTTAALGSAPTGAPRAKRPAPFLVELYRSALGKKYVMAITGIMLMGFVFGHMIGNLKMYLGPAEFDHYAEFLRELLVPILPRTVFVWLLRGGLIAAFALHIHAAYALTRMNQAARTTKYQSQRDYVAANFASRTMR